MERTENTRRNTHKTASASEIEVISFIMYALL